MRDEIIFYHVFKVYNGVKVKKKFRPRFKKKSSIEIMVFWNVIIFSVSSRFSNFPFRSVSFHDLANLFCFVSEKKNVPIFHFRKNNVSLFLFAWIYLFHRRFCASKAGLDFSSGSSILYNFSWNFWAVTWKFFVWVLNTNLTKFNFLKTMICVQYLRNWFLHRIQISFGQLPNRHSWK
jgi:hypothetical protein